MTPDTVNDIATQLVSQHAGDARFRVRLAPDILDDVAGALAAMGFLVARDSVERTLTVRDRRVHYSFAPGGCA